MKNLSFIIVVGEEGMLLYKISINGKSGTVNNVDPVTKEKVDKINKTGTSSDAPVGVYL